MHAALAIIAALAARQPPGEGAYLDVSVADGVLWLMSLAVDEHLATGTEPGPGHDILTGRYACYDTYRAADGGGWRSAPSSPSSSPTSAGRSAASSGRTTSSTTRCRTRSAPTSPPRSPAVTGDEWVAELAGADTCVAPVLTVAEVGADEQFAAPGRGRARPCTRPTARFRQVAPVLAGMAPSGRARSTCPTRSATDTEHAAGEAGVDAVDRSADWRAEGSDRVSTTR